MPATVKIITEPPNLNIPNNFYGIYDIYSTSIEFDITEHEQYSCRFCNESDRNKFTQKAHLIPEFTGNKSLISNFECDTCNAKFSRYESSLSAFGGIRDSLSLIKKKSGGYPKFKDEKNGIELKFENGTLELKIKKLNSPSVKINANKLTLEPLKQSYVPRFVLKSLVKIALGLLKKDDVKFFKQTFEWLSLPNDSITESNQSLMVLYGNEIRPPLQKPVGILCRKKTNYNAPEFCLLFMYGFHIYQVFIPFCTLDKEIDLLDIHHPIESHNVLKKLKHIENFVEFKDGVAINKDKYACSIRFMEMSSDEKKVGEQDLFESQLFQK